MAFPVPGRASLRRPAIAPGLRRRTVGTGALVQLRRRATGIRALAPSQLEWPTAQTALRRAAVAQRYARIVRDGELASQGAGCKDQQLSLQRRELVAIVGGGHRLLRLLEEQVHDLDRLRSGAQRCQRVDEPLDPVLALGDPSRIGALEPIALVVDDQHPAAGLARDDVNDARDQRVLKQEREALLPPELASRREPLEQRAGDEPLDQVAHVAWRDLGKPGPAEVK